MSDPELPPGKGAMAARDHLVQRLIERHDLDPDDAYAAVTLVQLGITDGPHAQLVAGEAGAAINEALAVVAATLTPVFHAIQEALRTFGEAAARATQANRADYVLAPPRPNRAARRHRNGTPARPAWQSPHGPASHHH